MDSLSVLLRWREVTTVSDLCVIEEDRLITTPEHWSQSPELLSGLWTSQLIDGYIVASRTLAVPWI